MQWHLNNTPYLVQSTALSAANADGPSAGFLYLLEQGLGKTAVILNEIIDYAWKDLIDVAVGFLPKTLLGNWRKEAEKVGFNGHVFLWPNWPTVDKIPKDGKPSLFLMNFEALITAKGEAALDAVFDVHRHRLYLFIDEASRIKNPSAQRTKKALYYGAIARYVRSATGTPITQNVGDLWAQLKFVGATKLRFFPWRNRHAKLGGYMGREIVGVNDPERLQAEMGPFAFTAKKKDWTDLPEKQYVMHQLSLAKAQAKAYAEMYEEMVTSVGVTEIEATLALTMMGKLQQIVSGFINDGDGKSIPLFKSIYDIPKLNHWLDVREESAKKQITFVSNIWSLETLLTSLEDRKAKPAIIRGGMTDSQRDEAVDRFNLDADCRDIICQIKAGGIGLTLLGQPDLNRCSVTHFYENTFSLEARLQAEDRNHRHGQDEMVTYHDYVSAEIDTRAVTALVRKENIANLVQDPLLWKP